MLRVPLTHNGDLTAGDNTDRPTTITLTGRVRWQACDDNACFLPGTHEFTLSVPIRPMNLPRFRNVGPDEMDSAAFLQAMIARR